MRIRRNSINERQRKWLKFKDKRINLARIVIVGLFLAFAIWAITLTHYKLIIHESSLGLWLTTALESLGPELAGIVIGIVIIDYLNERRQDIQLKGQLIRQMSSRHNDVAETALNELRAHGWLEDGSLRYADFEKANLFGANLKGADLRYANFKGATLSDANLRNANLQGANLKSSHLENSILKNANLQHANLWEAMLDGVNLDDAQLKNATLDHASLIRASLSRSDLSNATLCYANMERAMLHAANLYSANLSQTCLNKARLSHTCLNKANFSGANLQGANLIKAQLQGSMLYEANLSGADLENANLEGSHIGHADLSSANLKNAILERIWFLDVTDLENTTMPNGEILIGKRNPNGLSPKEWLSAQNYKNPPEAWRFEGQI